VPAPNNRHHRAALTKDRLIQLADRPHTYLPLQVFAEADGARQLFQYYAAEVKRVSGNDDGIITAAQGDIDTPTDGFADNTRLFLPPTVFNRFAVTRETNYGCCRLASPRPNALGF
jgi:hypothetical protein